MAPQIPLLIIAFNRPDFLESRLMEAERYKIPRVIVSIDGPNGSQNLEFQKLCSSFGSTESLGTQVSFIFRERSLGMARHVTTAISEVLESYPGVVVLEDDIEMSKHFFSGISSALQKFGNKYFGVSGFSPLSIGSKLPNCWRESKYISIWGWGVTSDAWKKYQFELKDSDLQALEKSHTWNKLSQAEREIWLRRFRKVIENPSFTWDSQIQFACFRYDLKNLSSVFRTSENLGFQDARSTNTKTIRPRILGKHSLNQGRVRNLRIPRMVSARMEVFDQISIAGTRKITTTLFRRRNRVVEGL
jgi:hypothetical protein